MWVSVLAARVLLPVKALAEAPCWPPSRQAFWLALQHEHNAVPTPKFAMAGQLTGFFWACPLYFGTTVCLAVPDQ